MALRMANPSESDPIIDRPGQGAGGLLIGFGIFFNRPARGKTKENWNESF